MIRRIWKSLVALLSKPVPEDIEAELQAEADRQAAKDKWLEDPARQTRQSAGTGPV
jgi:hypothetical protein